MDLAVAAAPAAGRERLRAVRAWWRVRRPGPTIGQRLDLLYTIGITAAILGALAYGTASSALAQVVTPAWLARFGPSIALAALLTTARWGAFQGPVVYSVPDVTHLLGAPLPRRGLAAGRLRSALAAGAVAGALAAGVVIVGLAGEGRGIAVGRAAGLAVGLAALGLLGVAAAWAVERSSAWDRWTVRAIWPAAFVGVGLTLAAGAGRVGREVALWSGPWGWTVQPGTHARTAAWAAALVLLGIVAIAAAAATLRTAGECPTERHLRRAEARASAIASLASFDARSARVALRTAGDNTAGRDAAGLPRLRRLATSRRFRHSAVAPIVWRDAVTARRTPGRVLEATVLTAAGAVLALTNAGRAASVAAAMLLVYLGAARMLWSLRAELDVPVRARLLLRPSLGRVVAAHTVVPVVVVTAATALAAIACAVAGGLPAGGGAAVLVALVAGPVVTCCAAMSARRGGRLPESVFAGALATDPSGGGLTILAWLAWWPALAAALGAAPLLVVAHGGAAGGVAAGAATLLVAAVLTGVLASDPHDA
jgi:hypothetical protein